MRRKNSSLIYVNYSPYENSGKLQDYLLENFENVYSFSIGHHSLGGSQNTNKLTLFKNGKSKKEIHLFFLPVQKSLVFLLLPFRSIINFAEIIWYSYLLKKEKGKVEYYFTVNGFTAWVGLILRKLGIVEKVVYWVWDYYPPEGSRPVIRIMRSIYWQFEKTTDSADKLVFLNKTLRQVWIEKGVIKASSKYPLVPIGSYKSKKVSRKSKKEIKIGFIGVIKKSQGLDFIFDSAKLINQKLPNVSFEFIGSGPDSEYFKERARKTKLKCKFHGYVDEPTFEKILSTCHIGIAPYVPHPSNVSFYGDPGKVKRYLGFGLPSIITTVFEFSEELKKEGAGEAVTYGDSKALVQAIKKIIDNYGRYFKNTEKLNNKFNYSIIYNIFFA